MRDYSGIKPNGNGPASRVFQPWLIPDSVNPDPLQSLNRLRPHSVLCHNYDPQYLPPLSGSRQGNENYGRIHYVTPAFMFNVDTPRPGPVPGKPSGRPTMDSGPTKPAPAVEMPSNPPTDLLAQDSYPASTPAPPKSDCTDEDDFLGIPELDILADDANLQEGLAISMFEIDAWRAASDFDLCQEPLWLPANLLPQDPGPTTSASLSNGRRRARNEDAETGEETAPADQHQDKRPRRGDHPTTNVAAAEQYPTPESVRNYGLRSSSRSTQPRRVVRSLAQPSSVVTQVIQHNPEEAHDGDPLGRHMRECAPRPRWTAERSLTSGVIPAPLQCMSITPDPRLPSFNPARSTEGLELMSLRNVVPQNQLSKWTRRRLARTRSAVKNGIKD